MFWGNYFCKNYKRITLQNKFPGLFSCKKGHTSGSNITKKIFWWNCFCNNYKKRLQKYIVPGNYFVIISARMVSLTFGPESESFRWKFAPKSFWIQITQNIFFEAGIFPAQMLRNFPKTLSLYLLGPTKTCKIPAKFPRKLSLQKIKTNSPTSFCRSVWLQKILGAFEVFLGISVAQIARCNRDVRCDSNRTSPNR